MKFQLIRQRKGRGIISHKKGEINMTSTMNMTNINNMMKNNGSK
jgi:hypothetical protein